MARRSNLLAQLSAAALALGLLTPGGTRADTAQLDSPSFTLDTTNPRPGVGGIAQAESAPFTLDTRTPTPGVGGSAQADSPSFTLDTRTPRPGVGGTAQADSPPFTLDTRAPDILIPPQSQTVNLGRTATFTVTAANGLFYQWRYNGASLPGATATAYIRTNAQLADAGSYSVVVSNNYGATLSAVALLTVMPPPPGVLALWTFNSQPGDTNASTGTTEPSFGSGTAALAGGTIAGFSAGDALDSESPSDNSAWDTSRYAGTTQQNKTHGVQFSVSTAGLKNIRVTWRESVTASASKWVRLQYATNGTFFDAPAATAMTAVGVFESKSNNLTAFTGLNNNPNAALRIVAEFESTAAGTGNAQYVTTSGGTYSSSGEILFDLVTVYADSTNVAPPTLVAPGLTSNRAFQLSLIGQSGSSYIIQGTTNLRTSNWTPLSTNVAPFSFVDSNAVLYPARFYRAVSLP